MVNLVKQTLKDVKRVVLFMMALFLVINLLAAYVIPVQSGFLRAKVEGALEENGIRLSPEGRAYFYGDLKNPDKGFFSGSREENFEEFKRIFIHNSTIVAAYLIVGFVPFLFLPLVGLYNSAAALGGIYQAFRMIPGFTPLHWASGVFLHGVIEMPAYELGMSLAIFLCLEITRRILRKNKMPIGRRIKGFFLSFLFVVIPLLFMAAVIETYLTPYIMQMAA